jgi:hypothetical protein
MQKTLHPKRPNTDPFDPMMPIAPRKPKKTRRDLLEMRDALKTEGERFMTPRQRREKLKQERNMEKDILKKRSPLNHG